MKRCWIVLFALALTLALCACKDKTEPEPTPTPMASEAVAEETPAPVTTELGSGMFDTYAASFVGAETFTAADGSDALRVYFDFMNLSDEAISASERLVYSAVQDGKTLVWAESPEPLDEEGNITLRLQPGNGIRCVLQFALLSDSTVAVSLSDVSQQSVSALLSLHQLPGAPEQAASADATQTEQTLLPEECTLFGLYSVAFSGSETQDTADGRTLTVSLDFTNLADPETAEPWDWVRLFAYQDGLELSPLLPEAEERYAVKRGDTVTVTQTYPLRSDSSVLVELFGFREEEASAGIVIPVA